MRVTSQPSPTDARPPAFDWALLQLIAGFYRNGSSMLAESSMPGEAPISARFMCFAAFGDEIGLAWPTC